MILLLYYSFCVVEPKKFPFLSGIIYRAGAGAGTGANIREKVEPEPELELKLTH